MKLFGVVHTQRKKLQLKGNCQSSLFLSWNKKCHESIYITYQSNATFKKVLCTNIIIVYIHLEPKNKRKGL